MSASLSHLSDTACDGAQTRQYTANNEAALQVTCTLALTCTPGLHAWLTTILIHTVLRRARVNSVRIRARDPYSDAVACRLAIEGCDFNLRLQGSSGAVSRSMAAVARARSRSRLATVGEYSPLCRRPTKCRTDQKYPRTYIQDQQYVYGYTIVHPAARIYPQQGTRWPCMALVYVDVPRCPAESGNVHIT